MTARQPRNTQLRCDDCGYQTNRTTKGIAQKALDSHSCDTHRERVARHERRLARAAASGPEAPCQHDGKHPHGDRSRYTIDGCRCRPCRDANVAYNRQLSRQHLYGRHPLVDANPAREHVRQLQAAGMGWKRIAEPADLDYAAITKLIYGARGRRPSVKIRPTLADKILAVQLDLAPAAVVGSTGSARRIQALCYVGWSIPRIAEAAGVDRQALDGILRGRAILVSTRDAITSTYERLWNTAPPEADRSDRVAATRARRRAATAGWAPPLAWDDETIEDPKAKPAHTLKAAGPKPLDEAAIVRRVEGDHRVQLTNAERREVVRRLHSQGLNDQEASRLTGISDRQVLRDRQRLGLPANTEPRRTSDTNQEGTAA
ncbi:MAG: hypothetical protein HOW59_02485 [Nonomuraea sp.]|nr:hypothetical protein [Nonomuraea sp.]NUQ32238.1 hypothetical protein [Dermatophilaceae bacterium]NUR81067.1 hypothetical protein [Dermatophilaceae bacterium]